MSRRVADALYAGARGTIPFPRIATLGPRYKLAPKYDGSYAVISTDRRGYVSSIVLRGGPAPVSVHAEFARVRWRPDAVLVCELELYTERAVRIVEGRGWRNAPILDALRLDGRDVSGLPQRERRDLLLRAESLLVQEDLDRPFTVDRSGDAHDLATGRYRDRTPLSWRRMPVAPQLPVKAAETAWSDWCDQGEAEGLVVVATDAPIGKRSAKRKCKSVSVTGYDSIDCTVVEAGELGVWLDWRGNTFRIRCDSWAPRLRVGMVVEIGHHGFLEHRAATPKNPRVKRIREDLSRPPCGRAGA